MKHQVLIRAVLLAFSLGATAAVPAVPAETGNGPPDPEVAAEAGSAAPPTFLPHPSTTRHEIEIDGHRIDYRATAGTLPLGQDLEKPEAHLFYVSYAIDEAGPTRPVAFVLNGGPGASAAYLHLGGLGPQRVLIADDGAAPPAPARIAPNAETWLTFTDLVFIDPVETGFSRTVTREDGERNDRRLLGTQPDLEALSAFIRLWLTRNQRWASPKFLVGESYGGFRVAALAAMLAERAGVQVNGAVLISPVLEFSLHDGDDYTLLPWVLRVPSFAAVARAHGKTTAGAAGPSSDRDGFLDEAETFSLGDLLPGLAQGAALPAPAAEALYRRLAGLVGLPSELVRRHAGRIPRGVFAKELLRADGRVISLYDGSIAGIDPEPARSSAPRDARLTRLTAALATAINDYLRRQLDYQTDTPYRVLNREVSRRWKWRDGGQGFIGAADDLKEVLSREPTFQVLIAHGVYDLVTLYFTSVYVMQQMRLDPELRDAVAVRLYEGGHMFYTHGAPRARLHADARRLFESASAGQRRADASPQDAPERAVP